jgi:hypothetical protein
MKIILQRKFEDNESTLGELFNRDDVFNNRLCYTLEDQRQDRKKVYGETRIPAGTYDIKLRTVGGFHKKHKARYGNMHKGMLWLQDVPNFEYILIHTGNTDDQTHGCLLVGLEAPKTSPYTIIHSRDAYTKIYPPIANAILRGEGASITIEDIT